MGADPKGLLRPVRRIHAFLLLDREAVDGAGGHVGVGAAIPVRRRRDARERPRRRARDGSSSTAGSRSSAGCLLATSPYFVKWSQQARAYPFLAAAAIVATLLLLRALERDGRAAWALYGLAFTRPPRDTCRRGTPARPGTRRPRAATPATRDAPLPARLRHHSRARRALGRCSSRCGPVARRARPHGSRSHRRRTSRDRCSGYREPQALASYLRCSVCGLCGALASATCLCGSAAGLSDRSCSRSSSRLHVPCSSIATSSLLLRRSPCLPPSV